MAPHSSTPAWKIPWMEEPGRLKSMGSLRVGHNSVTSLSLFTFIHWRRKWQPTPAFSPRESQGQWSLVGCHLWGCTELDMTEATQQQQQQLSAVTGKLRAVSVNNCLSRCYSQAQHGKLFFYLHLSTVVICTAVAGHISGSLFHSFSFTHTYRPLQVRWHCLEAVRFI